MLERPYPYVAKKWFLPLSQKERGVLLIHPFHAKKQRTSLLLLLFVSLVRPPTTLSLLLSPPLSLFSAALLGNWKGWLMKPLNGEAAHPIIVSPKKHQAPLSYDNSKVVLVSQRCVCVVLSLLFRFLYDPFPTPLKDD